MLELPPVATGLLAETLEKFIAEELRASGLAGYVVGLSGGVDSAVSAALAAAAVGRERVLALALPGPTSAPESIRDAQEVAETFGLRLEKVDLGASAELLAETLGARGDRVRFGNLLARLRMVALFDRARTVPRWCSGPATSRRSCSATRPSSATRLLPCSRWGTSGRPTSSSSPAPSVCPQTVVTKAPTADLWPGQTDAGELGFDYPTVDPVLYWHHEGGMGREELIAAGFPAALVDGALGAYRRNRFKWRPTVVARVSASCMNVDRILPRNPER